MMGEAPSVNFGVLGIDSELSLGQLLSETEQQQWLALAALLAGAPATFSPAPAPCGVSLALQGDCEPLAYLAAAEEGEGLRLLVTLLNRHLQSERKYLMASGLHEVVVSNDYQALMEEHKALQASEQRYKELSAQLEQRVAEQVQTIKRAERKLYHAEKLASVGQLAAGVAHEINNPIGFVTSNLSMAQRYVEQLQTYIRALGEQFDKAQLPRGYEELHYLFEDFFELLQESTEGCQRVSAIVRNLKVFSNVDGQARSRGSVNQLINNLCDLYANQIPQGIEIKKQLGDVPEITMNPGMLSQMLAQLLLNAVQAVREVQADRRGWILFSTSVEQEQIQIVVADNGCGMSAEVLHHVYEPFYTTRVVGSGTGLGLTVCRDVVRAHHGEIQVSSQLGRGTRVVVNLPLESCP